MAEICRAGTALRTSIAVKAPPTVPAPVYSWTGWYVGGNVGYGWGNARADIAGSGTSLLFPIAVPGFPGVPATLGFADSNTGRLDGVIGGAQFGYNYQFRPKWVVGFEADIQGSGQRGSGTFVTPLSAQLCTDLVVFPPPVGCDEFMTGNGTAATGYEAKIGWFGTVRGRLGFLITDQVLLYGTGGLAYGRVQVSGNTNAFISFPAQAPFASPGTSVFNSSKTNVGFAVGSGIEGELWANWTWKIEYLYLDLGSLDTVSPLPPAIPVGFGGSTPFAGTLTTHTHFTDNIVRVGLNYQFH
jgi:outer membrane immunogenic protein